MDVERLLSLISDNLLDQLAIETNVDHYAKKLQGEVIFKLLLYCIVSQKGNSLRSMESAYEKITFQLLNHRYNQGSIRFSSISERLSNINVEYFEKIYQGVVGSYKELIAADKNDYVRFDSTIVTLSGKLLEIGYHIKGGDAENVKQLKFTVGYSDIPEIVHFFHEQKYTSENIALKENILEQSKGDIQSIKVFDWGITARATYDEFTKNNIRFVARINDKAKNHLISKDAASFETSTLKIISDSWCYLYSVNSKKAKYPVRRIEAIHLQTKSPLVFVTNINDLDAVAITEIYKRRWDIEVFFKFIKQLLNFNHLLNRSINGIRVILYVTMIAAILLQAYKKTHKLTGFKIAKQKFEQELETAIIKDLILICGGNPELLNTLKPQNHP